MSALIILALSAILSLASGATGPLFEPNWTGPFGSTVERHKSDWSTCVFVSSDNDWQGIRVYGCVNAGECANVVPDVVDKVSSFGPDRGAGTCYLYREADCAGGESPGIWYPGNSNLAAIGWDNSANSLRCNGMNRLERRSLVARWFR